METVSQMTRDELSVLRRSAYPFPVARVFAFGMVGHDPWVQDTPGRAYARFTRARIFNLCTYSASTG